MLSLKTCLTNILNWIKGVADYPVSIQSIADTQYWVDQTLTKYKSGKMVYEGTRLSVSMNYIANGNAYIDYLTLGLSDYGFTDVKQAIVEMGYNDTPKGEHLLYCTDDGKGNLIAWVGALSAGSHTIINAVFKVTQRYTTGGHYLVHFPSLGRWEYA